MSGINNFKMAIAQKAKTVFAIHKTIQTLSISYFVSNNSEIITLYNVWYATVYIATRFAYNKPFSQRLLKKGILLLIFMHQNQNVFVNNLPLWLMISDTCMRMHYRTAVECDFGANIWNKI